MQNMNERFADAHKRCQSLMWTADNLYLIGISLKVLELLQRFDKGERTEQLLKEMDSVGK